MMSGLGKENSHMGNAEAQALACAALSVRNTTKTLSRQIERATEAVEMMRMVDARLGRIEVLLERPWWERIFG